MSGHLASADSHIILPNMPELFYPVAEGARQIRQIARLKRCLLSEFKRHLAALNLRHRSVRNVLNYKNRECTLPSDESSW